MEKISSEPTLKLSILCILIYQFASIPFTIGIAYALASIGYTADEFNAILSEIILIAQIGIASTLIILFVGKYLNYFLSDGWKKNYLLYLKIGLKWTLPLLILHAISFLIPTTREIIISSISSAQHITVKGASNLILFLFTILLIVGAIFEELFFRGIVVNKLKKVTNRNISVLFSAFLFALAHVIFFKVSTGNIASSFMVGILCGYAYTSTGSCLSAITPHLINNLIYSAYIWTIS